MAKKIQWKQPDPKPRRDTRKFWLWTAVVAVVVWILFGGLSFKADKMPQAFGLIVEMVCGLAPCVVLTAAVMAQMERKRDAESTTRKSQNLEHIVILMFFCIEILAELLFHAGMGRVSFALPVTISCVCFLIMSYIIAPKTAKDEKYDMLDFVKLFFFGIVSCVCLAQFIAAMVAFFGA